MHKEFRIGVLCCSVFMFISVAPFLPEFFHNIVLHYFIHYLRQLCNVKVNVFGNKDLLLGNYIFMSNHYEGIDHYVLYPLITTPFSNGCYVIAKDDLLGRQYPINALTSVMDFIIKRFYESGNLIPYARGDKNSGELVKNKCINILNNNKKLLVFPEGRSWRKGACHEFKPGMFKLASMCNKNIVPITLKYRNFDGKNKGEKCILQDWMDIEVDVFIHDKVLPKNEVEMLEETFQKISSKN